jgi:hypothetical protein
MVRVGAAYWVVGHFDLDYPGNIKHNPRSRQWSLCMRHYILQPGQNGRQRSKMEAAERKTVLWVYTYGFHGTLILQIMKNGSSWQTFGLAEVEIETG